MTFSRTSIEDKICKKFAQHIGTLKRIKSCLPCSQRLVYYHSVIKPIYLYASTVWSTCSKNNLVLVLRPQKRLKGLLWMLKKSFFKLNCSIGSNSYLFFRGPSRVDCTSNDGELKLFLIMVSNIFL